MKRVLLHSCCAPCSAPILEWMLNNDIVPTLFFFNPNIFPIEEYLKRKEECIRYAKQLRVDFIDEDYNHDNWLQRIAGLENQPERGMRCFQCFKIRLEATALFARENKFPVFTTTLAGSRWKSLTQIIEAGQQAATLVGRVDFWEKDWNRTTENTVGRKQLLQPTVLRL